MESRANFLKEWCSKVRGRQANLDRILHKKDKSLSSTKINLYKTGKLPIGDQLFKQMKTVMAEIENSEHDEYHCKKSETFNKKVSMIIKCINHPFYAKYKENTVRYKKYKPYLDNFESGKLDYIPRSVYQSLYLAIGQYLEKDSEEIEHTLRNWLSDKDTVKQRKRLFNVIYGVNFATSSNLNTDYAKLFLNGKLNPNMDVEKTINKAIVMIRTKHPLAIAASK